MKKHHSESLMDWVKDNGGRLLVNIEDKFILYQKENDGIPFYYRFSWDENEGVYRNSCFTNADGLNLMLHAGEDFIRKTAMKTIKMDSSGITTINKNPNDN